MTLGPLDAPRPLSTNLTADLGLRAVVAYASGTDRMRDLDDDPQGLLMDLLQSVRVWADASGLDFDA